MYKLARQRIFGSSEDTPSGMYLLHSASTEHGQLILPLRDGWRLWHLSDELGFCQQQILYQ